MAIDKTRIFPHVTNEDIEMRTENGLTIVNSLTFTSLTF